MPELPEVETIRRQLEQEIVGEKIVDVWYDRAKILRPNPEAFIEGVVEKTIADVRRRAKLLIINLDDGYIVSHLRLSGRILIRAKDDAPDDYVHAILKLKSQSAKRKSTAQDVKSNEDKSYQRELRFAEARLFGYLEYLPNQKALDKKLAGFGPEFFDLGRERFPGILAATRKAIKPLLMDQKRIAGIGNIYANDALYLAKIHPETPANQISQEKAYKLYDELKNVLEEGIKRGGASDQWYRQIHGEKGRYQQHFKIYGKVGKKCARCGATIERIVVGGRGTFICPKCQKLSNC